MPESYDIVHCTFSNHRYNDYTDLGMMMCTRLFPHYTFYFQRHMITIRTSFFVCILGTCAQQWNILGPRNYRKILSLCTTTLSDERERERLWHIHTKFMEDALRKSVNRKKKRFFQRNYGMSIGRFRLKEVMEEKTHKKETGKDGIVDTCKRTTKKTKFHFGNNGQDQVAIMKPHWSCAYMRPSTISTQRIQRQTRALQNKLKYNSGWGNIASIFIFFFDLY